MNTINKGPERIGSIINNVLSDAGYLNICKEYEIVRKWTDIVGNAFAAVTKCEKIENGILYVKVTTASWRQEAVYLKSRILENAFRETGCNTIKDIVFF